MTTVRISLARVSLVKAKLVASALAPAVAPQASRATFGGTEPKQGDLVIIDGQVTEMKRAPDGHCHNAVVRHCGLASHVRAQPRGVADSSRACGGGSASQVVDALSVHIFGDASMCIASPPPPTSLVGHAATDSRQHAVAARGKNVHVPVLNACEMVFARRDGGGTSSLRGCEIFKPVITLPAANATATRECLAPWSALTARGAGRRLSASSDLANVVSTTQWRTLVVAPDNLCINDVVLALEESALSVARYYPLEGNAGNRTTMISFPGFAHSAALASQPLMQSMHDVPSKLVKLGRSLESGRAAEGFLRPPAAVIDEAFGYRRCRRLPDEATT